MAERYGMSWSFNWRGLRGEVAAGVSDALGQTASQEAYYRLEEENRKKIDDLAAKLGETVTNEDVRNLLSRMNLHLIFSGSIMMNREDAVKIIEVLCNQDMELQRLRKIVGAMQEMVGAAADEPMIFAGVEVEEAIDRVLSYPEALKYIPKTCKTCKYHSGGKGYLHPVEDRPGSGCLNTYDSLCHWEWNGKHFEEE